MEIGQLRHRVQIWGPTEQPDAYGDGEYAMAALSEDDYRWADVHQLTGEERASNSLISAEATHEIRMRYHSTMATDMELHWDSRIFKILSIQNLHERNRELAILAKELV